MAAIRVHAFFRLPEGSQAVFEAAEPGSSQKRAAFFGDGLLKGIATKQMYASTDKADVGKLTLQRKTYEANAVMAVFLQMSDVFTLAPAAREVGVHALGTIFEALLWSSHLHDAVAAETVVANYMHWVDENIDYSIIEEKSVTTWQLPGGQVEITTEDLIEVPTSTASTQEVVLVDHLLREVQQKHSARTTEKRLDEGRQRMDSVREEVVRNRLPTVAPNEGIGHDWTGPEKEQSNKHVLPNRTSTSTWHGRQCNHCKAFSVFRKTTNKHGRYFLLGLEQCPEVEPNEWLPQYQEVLSTILISESLPGERITREQLEAFGFLSREMLPILQGFAVADHLEIS